MARRERGRILTERGFKKIWDAIHKAFPDRRTLVEISALTDPGNFVSTDTVSHILKQRAGTDRAKMESLFKAFGLTLDEDDHISAADFVGRSGGNAQPRTDWGEAPDVSGLCGRTGELATLKQWVVLDRCRLVAIWGMGGIGKTALSVKLAQEIEAEFECVIWRSLRHAPPVGEMLANLLQVLSVQPVTDLPATVNERLSRLVEYLASHRCLLVLDAWETVLSSGQPAGHYREGYEGYGELLTRVAETQHQSCLVLTSWEKPRKIALLESPIGQVRCLLLKGLDSAAAREILKVYRLSDEDKWEKQLIQPYKCHPLALKIVAGMIQELFGGSVTNFLKEFTLFIDDELESLLDQQFNRLSKFEREIMYKLAEAKQPVSISQLRESLQLQVSRSEFFDNLQALGRRSLIEKLEADSETLFTLQPVVMKYVAKQSYRN
jgi:hypothetical protein